MPLEESKSRKTGKQKASFYANDLRLAKEELDRNARYSHVVKVEEMPWEESPQGLLKHLAHEGLNPLIKDTDMYIQEIPAGGFSGKHRHMAEELMYILEGKGYSLHWDVEFDLNDHYKWIVPEEGKRFEWEEGDLVFIPVNTVHQHFNSDSGRLARFISASCRVYNSLGWNDLEQLGEASPIKGR